MIENTATERGTEGADFHVGEWRVSPSLNRISINGDHVSLQNLSMQVLVYLAEKRGSVATYDELLDALWPNRVVGEEAVHRRVADLRKHMRGGVNDAKFIQNIPKKGYRLVAPIKPAQEPGPNWLRRAAAASLFVLGVVALTAMLGQDPDVPPDAPEPVKMAIETAPPGAMVSFKSYADADGDWQPLGVTPFETEFPVGTYRLRFIADGHEPVIMTAPNPSTLFNNIRKDFFVVELPVAAEVPDGMVFIPSGNHLVPLAGFHANTDLGEFYIGRTEVSNAEFAEFVDAGGYYSRELWQDLADDEAELEFEDVGERFVDSTGNPGPATWVDGTYAAGEANLPVTGVSWYEAMAYARFRGMKLPTARHWARAALGINEGRQPLAPDLLPAARIDAPGLVPVDDDAAMSTWGAVNLIGNVQEWTTTRDGESRLTLGTSFSGPQWQYALPTASLPTQRLPDQGIRLALYDDNVPDPQLMMSGAVPEVPRPAASEFDEYMNTFAYVPGTVMPEMVSRVSSVEEYDWVRERYILESEALPGPLPILVFRPKESPVPLQPVIFLPPGDSYFGTITSDGIDITNYGIDFVVRSGRALVWPIIVATQERRQPRGPKPIEERTQRWLDAKRIRRMELGAVIDYLDYSREFNGEKVSVLAASFGATFVSPHILVAEHRIKTAMLMSTTLANVDTSVYPDIVNPNTYWPQVTLPVLILNGRYDISTQSLQSRELLLHSIGTDEDQKRGIIYESTHWPLPPHRVESDVTEWLDRQLGPANSLY